MKTILALLLSLSILARFTNAGCCGDAEPVHPAKALYEEFEALGKLVKPSPLVEYKAEFAPAIKACREKILAYTKTHQGGDLDGLNWARAFERVYLTSAWREWRTYGESEANVREAWGIIAKATPENPHTAADLSLMIARWHIQGWCESDPEACAAFMDEAELDFRGNLSPNGLAAWKFVVPDLEESFILGAESLPPDRRAAFAQKRETGLFRHLQDESISVNTRTDQLAAYANQLYGKGEADRAAPLLDAWWAKYGEAIQSAQFYSERFHIACYGTGDWSKAREALRRMDKLVLAGVIPADEGLYRLVVTNYYKNIVYPEYEMKRRAVIFNAALKKKSPGTTPQ